MFSLFVDRLHEISGYTVFEESIDREMIQVGLSLHPGCDIGIFVKKKTLSNAVFGTVVCWCVRSPERSKNWTEYLKNIYIFFAIMIEHWLKVKAKTKITMLSIVTILCASSSAKSYSQKGQNQINCKIFCYFNKNNKISINSYSIKCFYWWSLHSNMNHKNVL